MAAAPGKGKAKSKAKLKPKSKPKAKGAISAKAPGWLKKMRCPVCASPRLAAQAARKGNWGAWGVPGIICRQCGEKYPVVKGGILRMIPKGDYSRYAYWEKMHRTTPPSQIVALYKRRFQYPEKFLLHYYSMPRLARKLGWQCQDGIELGCQWGSNTLTLHRFGVVKNVWLLDISVAALEGALAFYKEFGLTPYAIQGEIHGLPFKDKAFDLSLSGGLYEHFVDQEQEELVRENCRISQKVLCQVPESSAAYWIYRKLVEWRLGKWPFGFEAPLSRRRLLELYRGAGTRVVEEDFHNLASAAFMVAGERWPLVRALTVRPFLFYMVRHHSVIAAENKEKNL
jgi:hypothetical protein